MKKLAGRIVAAMDGDLRFCRLHFKLPQEEARKRARREFKLFPLEAYLTEIDHWQEFPDGLVEFTVRRLRKSRTGYSHLMIIVAATEEHANNDKSVI